MNAICGIYSKTESLADNALTGMMNALAAWGRDGNRTWRGGRVALGCQITHVTPESLHETLPLSAAGLVITADARLDNREELLAQLPITDPQSPAEITDSLLILHAYRKWGTDCPNHLLGDFAFAIWDAVEEQLFCARDFIGARPFYYYSGKKTFVFASDVEAVLAATGVPPDLDIEFISAHLRVDHGYLSFERTFFAAVHKLPPAHALTADASGSKTWRFWDPAEAHEVRFAQEQEYVEALLDLFGKSIDCRLRSAFPIASHLSSGLDSSAIAVHAARTLRAKGSDLAMGFSWAAPPTPEEFPLDDERKFIEEISQLENIPVSYSSSSTREFAAELLRRRTLAFGDIPFESAVRRMLADGGMRVMLSGWGGDEFITFNGRGFFAEMFLRGRWSKCFRELKQRSVLTENTLWDGAKEKVITPLLPDWILRWLKPSRLPWLKRQRIPAVFNAEFTAQLRNADLLPEYHLRERAGVHRQQIDLLERGHLMQRIEGWAQGGGKSGVEYRYPLLDRRLVEFALGLPPDMFMHTGWKRYLYRYAMQDILPDDVRWHKVKDSPARPQRVKFQASAMREQVIPLLSSILEDRSTVGRSLACLDAKRMQAALPDLAQIAEEDSPNKATPQNLLAAIGIELLQNPALAQEIQDRIKLKRD